MQRLLLEVQAEKERLIRSLAAGSVENIITSSDECQNNGSVSNYTSPNSLNLNQLDSSFNPPSSIVHRIGSKFGKVKPQGSEQAVFSLLFSFLNQVSPTKDSSPESRTQSISDIGASASQVNTVILN